MSIRGIDVDVKNFLTDVNASVAFPDVDMSGKKCKVLQFQPAAVFIPQSNLDSIIK
jgi:hypothetical protein